MSLTAADVERLAALARIELTDDELAHLAPQLGVIVEAVARVQELDTDGVEPTSHPRPLVNVHRADVPGRSLSCAEALSQAPAAEDDRFRVPQILGEEQ